MDGMELVSFRIIASVGSARSLYISAIDEACRGNYEEAEKMIAEGRQAFIEGHEAHAELLQKIASGETVVMDLLMTHAEDQLMSAEAFGILAERFIDLNRKIDSKQAENKGL